MNGTAKKANEKSISFRWNMIRSQCCFCIVMSSIGNLFTVSSCVRLNLLNSFSDYYFVPSFKQKVTLMRDCSCQTVFNNMEVMNFIPILFVLCNHFVWLAAVAIIFYYRTLYFFYVLAFNSNLSNSHYFISCLFLFTYFVW